MQFGETGDGTEEAGSKHNRWEQLANALRSWLILALVVGLFSLAPKFREVFWTRSYLPDVFQQSARNVVLAVGMSFVILTGGIDLSVGSVVALSGVGLALSLAGNTPRWLAFLSAVPVAVTIAWLVSVRVRSLRQIQRTVAVAGVLIVVECALGLALGTGLANGVKVEGAVLVAIAIGISCGLMNGLGVSIGKVPPFIMTLGMMSAARGLTLFATNGASVSALVPRLMALGQNSPMFIITLLVVGLGAVGLNRMKAGRYFLTIGGNEQATRLSGVDVSLYKTVAYALSGLCAGIAAVMVTAMFGQASTNAATGAELDAIAAVVIGGTSLSGGRGSILGALVGALTITVITSGLILIGVQETLQQVVLGAVIVLTVFVDQARHRTPQ